MDSPKKQPNFPLQISYPISKNQDLCIVSLLKNWAGNFGQEIGRGFGRKNREENWMGFKIPQSPGKIGFRDSMCGARVGRSGEGRAMKGAWRGWRAIGGGGGWEGCLGVGCAGGS